MDLDLSTEHLQFREEVIDFLNTEMPEDMRRAAKNGHYFSHKAAMSWHRTLYEKGWVAPNWPEEYGGTGWDTTRRFIFSETLASANAPELSPFGLVMVGPLLIQFGTDEQKQRFLPKILSGDEVWCQGYSEPNAGSDLAALQLRADKDGDDYILNGQKTWTTNAQYADWIFVLARTSQEGRKQEGISFLLADINSTDGIDVKPFLTTGGTKAFSETWFKDARVPQANRVGPENGGWSMAKALLGHERTAIGGVAEAGAWVTHVKRIAARTPVGKGTLLDDPNFRRRIAALEMRLRTVTMTQNRALADAELDRAPGPESSILKLVGTETYQEITELAMDAMGHDAMGWQECPTEVLPEFETWIASRFNYLRASTIYGGSNEIQRNVVAKQILRMPS
ncbi:MAG: acyl-CoA dehydrogenase family protein [Myxococcota bacterium]|nr:acyl-CoA dehydrogenase family protein [Myxococcota bacterium]